MARTLEPHDLGHRDVPSRPPGLRPTWTTWMWLFFAIAFVVLLVVGFWDAGTLPDSGAPP